jgi:hypothetical protein
VKKLHSVGIFLTVIFVSFNSLCSQSVLGKRRRDESPKLRSPLAPLEFNSNTDPRGRTITQHSSSSELSADKRDDDADRLFKRPKPPQPKPPRRWVKRDKTPTRQLLNLAVANYARLMRDTMKALREHLENSHDDIKKHLLKANTDKPITVIHYGKKRTFIRFHNGELYNVWLAESPGDAAWRITKELIPTARKDISDGRKLCHELRDVVAYVDGKRDDDETQKLERKAQFNAFITRLKEQLLDAVFKDLPPLIITGTPAL